jgi:hypothetical protein
VLVSVIIAVAATFLSEHYSGPVMLFWSTEILCASGMTGGAVRSTDLRENPVLPSAAERPRDRRFCGTLNAVRPVTDDSTPEDSCRQPVNSGQVSGSMRHLA